MPRGPWPSVILATILNATLVMASEGQTLDEAISAGDVARVAILLDEGADLEKLGVKSPLYLAAERGRADVMRLLIARGADVDGLTRFGSPLHIAARRNRVEAVELLLASGADANIVGNEYDTTPLHEAADTGAVEAAMLLLAHGADVNKRTGNGHPAIHRAATKGHEDVVTLLRNHGASPMAVEPRKPGELAAADPAKGKVRIHECERCHVTVTGEAVSGAAPGPNLWNVVGREIASVPGYAYSEPLEALDGTWTFEELNRFIADPTGYVPGTNMYLGGESDRRTRIALISYLTTLSDNPVPLE